jgi:hypothetical protein
VETQASKSESDLRKSLNCISLEDFEQRALKQQSL